MMGSREDTLRVTSSIQFLSFPLESYAKSQWVFLGNTVGLKGKGTVNISGQRYDLNINLECVPLVRYDGDARDGGLKS